MHWSYWSRRIGIQIVALPRGRGKTVSAMVHLRTVRVSCYGGSWPFSLECHLDSRLQTGPSPKSVTISNFQRPHQGIGGLVPADRFFGAAPDVLRTLKA